MKSYKRLSQFPWEINNVSELHMYQNSDGTYRFKMTEETQVGRIITQFDKVSAVNFDLDTVGSIYINSMKAE